MDEIPQRPGSDRDSLCSGAACFGAAYEFLFNTRYQVAKNHIKDKAPITYITAEPFAAHFGIGGFGNAQKMCEWMFNMYHIDYKLNSVIKEAYAPTEWNCRMESSIHRSSP
ncbi:MAG: hypothetical protein IPI29_06535 [Ignavibacteria bacterium]|nr:hypothetical protein [Ignavibacteria bacterium]